MLSDKRQHQKTVERVPKRRAQSQNPESRHIEFLVGREGFEPPKAEPSDLQSDAFDRFATDP